MIRFLSEDLGVPNGFFTREGGVSTGPHASLNCSRFGTDSPANVAENRARAVEKLGGSPNSLAGLRQVHGARVVISPAADAPCVDADAMVTDLPSLALGIVTADCAPVLFASRDGRVVGAAHAGWRGALAGVLEATADAMLRLGATGISAVIGPCIHPASYEVGPDLRAAVLAYSQDHDRFFTPGRVGHWQFDLPRYCATRLAAARIDTKIMPDDTFSNEIEFFSHRRRTLRTEGAGGHQISIIMRAP